VVGTLWTESEAHRFNRSLGRTGHPERVVTTAGGVDGTRGVRAARAGARPRGSSGTTSGVVTAEPEAGAAARVEEAVTWDDTGEAAGACRGTTTVDGA
jgi:hypothetical protein